VQIRRKAGKGEAISFAVQPCMMAAGTAVTEVGRAGIGMAKLPNPYICKVRLVE